MNVLFSELSDFISVVHQLTIKCRLRSISASCRCNGRRYAHVQGRTPIVHPRGFNGAAGFCMLQLRVQEGAAAQALPVALSENVAKSLLDVGDVVMRRQDTSPTAIQVEKPFVRDLSTGLRFF